MWAEGFPLLEMCNSVHILLLLQNVDVFRTFGIGPICKEERLSAVHE